VLSWRNRGSLSGGAILSVGSSLSLADSTLSECAGDLGGCIFQAGGALRLQVAPPPTS
jgi:hypothetical protein